MKRAEGCKGRAEGHKGWLKRAEGCKILGSGAAPLYFDLAGTLHIVKGNDVSCWCLPSVNFSHLILLLRNLVGSIYGKSSKICALRCVLDWTQYLVRTIKGPASASTTHSNF